MVRLLVHNILVLGVIFIIKMINRRPIRLSTVGYHLDPCIATPGSPKGISDLLLVARMTLLHHADVSYLGLSFESLDSISRGDIAGVPPLVSHPICELYRHVVHRLPLRGKRLTMINSGRIRLRILEFILCSLNA